MGWRAEAGSFEATVERGTGAVRRALEAARSAHCGESELVGWPRSSRAPLGNPERAAEGWDGLRRGA